MDPNLTGRDSDGPGDDSDQFDAWRAFQKATDQKRANIIGDIVGHPKGAPSVEEISYREPSLSDDSARRHLRTLVEVGVVTEQTLEQGERVHGYPRKFFQLTDDARELFDENGLFPREPWRRQYERVEKTARIKELEQMPRPDE